MTNQSSDYPPDVADALQKLETAQSATDLGPAYSTVMHWRPPRRERAMRLGPFQPWLLSPWLFYLVVSQQQSEWLQGFTFAFATVGTADFLIKLLSPLFGSQDPIRERVSAALDRWRHRVPLMKELPK